MNGRRSMLLLLLALLSDEKRFMKVSESEVLKEGGIGGRR